MWDNALDYAAKVRMQELTAEAKAHRQTRKGVAN